jgi:hypothetical protein
MAYEEYHNAFKYRKITTEIWKPNEKNYLIVAVHGVFSQLRKAIEFLLDVMLRTGSWLNPTKIPPQSELIVKVSSRLQLKHPAGIFHGTFACECVQAYANNNGIRKHIRPSYHHRDLVADFDVKTTSVIHVHRASLCLYRTRWMKCGARA